MLDERFPNAYVGGTNDQERFVNLLFLLSALLSALTGVTACARGTEPVAQQMNGPAAAVEVTESRTAIAARHGVAVATAVETPRTILPEAIIVVSHAWPLWLNRPRE